MTAEKKTLGQRAKGLWNYFSTYEKIWFFSIIVLAVIFAFLFPETDDPTYSVVLTPDGYGTVAENAVFDTLDFSGVTDDFVLVSVTVNGGEYPVGKFTEAGDEFTVTPDAPDTLTVKLPVTVTAKDTVEVECYADGESDTLHFSVVNGTTGDVLVGGDYELSEGMGGDGYSVVLNPQFFVSVAFLMFLYLADTVFNIACELLISKQSRWNFLVSLAVEITEIVICIVCMYRFATMAVTLFFWIPCDIVSFIVWSRHKDREEDELTVVKTLKPWQDVLLVLGIVVWTAVIGYLLTFLDVPGGVFGNNILLKNIACYLDACVSAVGIANGLFILFRYREQWLAWYLSAILETVINIMAGQYVLLVLKLGYLTNTTYGYIKWSKYIKSRGEQSARGASPASDNR